MNSETFNPEELAANIRREVSQLRLQGRQDLVLQAIGGVSALEELRMEAAKGSLSPLVITRDYRFLLPAIQQEVELTPVHKAVYLLFLCHPEGIELKCLSDYRRELLEWYRKTARLSDLERIEESVAHLVNPLDNAINEKCSRIKKAFCDVMDEYSAAYYMISGHKKRVISGSAHAWFQRLKIITLPRHLVVWEATGQLKESIG